MRKLSTLASTVTLVTALSACGNDVPQDNPDIGSGPIPAPKDAGPDLIDMAKLDMNQAIDATMQDSAIEMDINQSDLDEIDMDTDSDVDLGSESPIIDISFVCSTRQECLDNSAEVYDRLVAAEPPLQLKAFNWGTVYIPLSPDTRIQEGNEEQPTIHTAEQILNPVGIISTTSNFIDRVAVLLPQIPSDIEPFEFTCDATGQPCQLKLNQINTNPQNSSDLAIRNVFIECLDTSTPSVSGQTAVYNADLEVFTVSVDLQDTIDIDPSGCQIVSPSLISKTGLFVNELIRETIYTNYRGESLVFGKNLD